MPEIKEAFTVRKTADAFSSREWDHIVSESVKFRTSTLYRAFLIQMQENVHLARSDMEAAKDTSTVFKHQGRVLAHKRDIMIFEDLLEIARNPSPKRTTRHA